MNRKQIAELFALRAKEGEGGGGGGGKTDEEREAAEKARQKAQEELEAKLQASEKATKALEERIAKLTADREAERKKGAKDGDLAEELVALKRDLADQRQANQDLKDKVEKAEKRAAQKTIDADVRGLLEGEVPDINAALKYLGGDLRVDDDGKPSIRLKDGADEWGNLSKEKLLERLPDVLRSAKGSAGSGEKGTKEEVASKNIIEKGLASQEEFEKNADKIKNEIRKQQVAQA